MSYDLDLHRGSIDEDEAERPPLDFALVEAELGALPGIEREGDELYWELEAVFVTFFCLRLPDGTLRSVGAEVVPRDEAADEAAREEYRRVLDVMLGLAQKLGARVYDPQLGGYVDPAAAGESVDSFG